MKKNLSMTTFRLFAGFMIVLVSGSAAFSQNLSATDVQTIIAQAVSTAVSMNQRVTVSVTDTEGHLLGTFQMTGASTTTLIRSVGRAGQGLENLSVPSTAAAQSKAGTAAILSSGGNAFTTRTASFIIQEHFPPGIDNTSGGPLYGVQFSTLTCSDIAIAGLPLGLAGDPGGLPLYRNGVAVGGIGIEGDGLYTIDRNPADNDQTAEEMIAVGGLRGFEAPALIRGDNILVGGVRFPYANVDSVPAVATMPFASLPGIITSPIVATPASDFIPATLNGVSGQMSSRFPIVAGSALTVTEVTQILGEAAAYANRTRAAIRQPIGSNARVTMSVVDTNGNVLGIFRQTDAPVFGLDVAIQKARTANFFALGNAGTKLTTAGFGSYVTRAAADGLGLNGSIAFSDRGFGFIHRPLFPDGINGTMSGPFSTEFIDWSPFNNGLQLDLVKGALTTPCATPRPKRGIDGRRGTPNADALLCPCTAIPELKNGIQIFAGGIPLYRGSTLVGAIGVSGDGIDQDDLISAGGANSFAAPDGIRSDKFFVRGVRLPFLKFPARPFL
jgi:uncharacterized protein GlcG (DUF336 family)